MPVSYAALISGMLTLIATTPNLVVHEELKYAGYEASEIAPLYEDAAGRLVPGLAPAAVEWLRAGEPP